MATLNIQRVNEYNNRLKDYKIFIDGKQVGTIQNGETKAFSTSPGQHTLTAKVGWYSSDVSVDMNDDEIKYLKVGSFKNSHWIMSIVSGIIALHFILKLTINSNQMIFLVIPAFLLLIYYLTIGRKKHLVLTEIENCN